MEAFLYGVDAEGSNMKRSLLKSVELLFEIKDLPDPCPTCSLLPCQTNGHFYKRINNALLKAASTKVFTQTFVNCSQVYLFSFIYCAVYNTGILKGCSRVLY